MVDLVAVHEVDAGVRVGRELDRVPLGGGNVRDVDVVSGCFRDDSTVLFDALEAVVVDVHRVGHVPAVDEVNSD